MTEKILLDTKTHRISWNHIPQSHYRYFLDVKLSEIGGGICLKNINCFTSYEKALKEYSLILSS